MSGHSLRTRRAAACAVLAVLTVGAPAAAQQAKPLGTFDAWSAFVFGEGRAKVCYAHAVPEKSEGEYTRRGDTYVQITHRPADKAFNEVSVTAGYGYKPGGDAEIEIDGNKYALFTKDDVALTMQYREESRWGNLVPEQPFNHNSVIMPALTPGIAATFTFRASPSAAVDTYYHLEAPK